MSSIHLLPDSLINKIAAGEVVERPASVVKELLDNSIDAGAKQITIEIADGGKKSILVRDDGCGIEADDLLMAVSRHATSKIKSERDLFAINTLGFRGEALASIASVSKLTLTSRRLGESAGHEIKVEGGKVISEQMASHPVGTTVLVKYLFYATPARLKFLKSAETEVSHIADDVTRLALAHPQLSFRLFHNGKKMISTEPAADFKRRISDLFGSDIAKSCYEIKGGNRIEVTGFVGHPQISRSHQRNMYFLVNGRPVRDRVITHAVMEAHRDALMRGRYPFIVLLLTLPSEMVDVNVHPAKAEVRFSDSSLVHRAVVDAVKKTLEGKPWEEGIRDLGLGTRKTEFYEPRIPNPEFLASAQQIASAIYQAPDQLSLDSALPLPISKGPTFSHTPFSRLNVIGQLMGTYLLCEANVDESNRRFVLIDQHAAHERIGFEKLLSQHQTGTLKAEPLLIPETFDLKPSEAEILKKYLDELQSFGLEIEFFGGCTFVIKAVPQWLKSKGVVKNLLLDLIGEILEQGKLTSLQDRLHAVLASVSCHGAIRANHRLSIEEMRGLVQELSQFPTITTCPHGRPVAIEISSVELEKWFKRKL